MRLDTFDRDYLALDDPARSKVTKALGLLALNNDAPELDLQPMLDKQSVYSVRVDGSLRLSFKYMWGVVELRQIQVDETLEGDS